MTRLARLALLLLVSWGLQACAPSLQSSNYEKRVEAVRRLGAENQALLAQVAIQDKTDAVRAAAVEKLTDQAVLAKAAISDASNYVRDKAVKRLTDQALLARVLIEGTDGDIREEALKKLTDQAVLANVALEKRDGYQAHTYRGAAVEKLTDQAVLAKVALGDPDKWVRAAAVSRLTDQALLARFALTDDNESFLLRLNAVPRLEDQAVLAKVALGSTDHQVRAAAVKRLEDQAVLAKIAEEDGKLEVRELAAGRLTAAGRQRLGQLHFEKIRDSEDPLRLRAFLSQYPIGPCTSEAKARLRKILYSRAAAEKSCGAYAEFTAEFPQDPAANEMRRRLAARGQWEKAKRLGELAIAMTPEIGIDGKGKLVNTNPTPLKPAIEQFRVLLAAGADPAAVRIKNSASNVTVQGDRWMTTHVGQSLWSVSPDGSAQMNAFQEAPRPARSEQPVPAAEGGLTLAEYAKASEGSWAAARACENLDPDFPSLAQEVARLLEQPAAKAGAR